MQIESRVAESYSSDTGINGTGFSTISQRSRFTKPSQIQAKHLAKDSKTDQVSAAVVIGMTALFIAFIFGMVTSLVPSFLENLLLSVFMGLCVGVIAFALMKEEEE